jgi:hypothetical protein
MVKDNVIVVTDKQPSISCYCSCQWGETTCVSCGHQRAYCLSPRWNVRMDSHGGITLTGEILRETCPSTTLSTTNPTLSNPGANPGLCSVRPATDRLSHGTALSIFLGRYLSILRTWFWS